MNSRTMKRPIPSLSSLLVGVIVGLLSLLSRPAAAMTAEEVYEMTRTNAMIRNNNPNRNLEATTIAAAPDAGQNNDANLAKGQELMGEMESLHRALAGLNALIQRADIPAEDEIMSKAAKLVRRVRSMVHATETMHDEMNYREAQRQRRMARREERIRNRKTQMLRGGQQIHGGIGSGEVEMAMDEEVNRIVQEQEQTMGMEDYVTRKLYDSTITFPECKEKFLADCIEILNQQMVDLQIQAELIVHDKRNVDQEGYNKVVIVTDLSGQYVKGKLNDGVVDYPFMWDDAVLMAPRMLGVQGQWDCHGMSPEDCCAKVQDSCPNEDRRGNKLMCHIFVPYGGAGNAKRDDRIFINLSPDSRVQEAPFLA